MPKPLANSEFTTGLEPSTDPSWCFENIDFVHALLFNREQVHQSVRSLSPFRTYKFKEEFPAQEQKLESGDHVVETVEPGEEETRCKSDPTISYSKHTDMVARNPKKTPPKKAPAITKPKRRLAAATKKKRSPSAGPTPERALKMQKRVPKANSGKRVNGRGASLADAVVIFDSEDDDFISPRHTSKNNLTPPCQLEKIDSPGSEYELDQPPMSIPTPTRKLRSTSKRILEKELSRMEELHARDLDIFSMQVSAAEAKLTQAEENAKREALKLQRDHSIQSDKHTADLVDELEVQRRRTSDLAWECDHLRRENEAARSCLKGEADLTQQREEYKRLYNEEQDVNAGLMRDLDEKEKEATTKAVQWAAERERLTQQTEALQREASDLRNEITALRESAASAAKLSLSRLRSCSVSLSTSEADQRLANSRKTYITVKRRYDNLSSVASNIAVATQAWDYSGLGELGQYLRQLRSALYDNGPGDLSGMSASQVAKVE